MAGENYGEQGPHPEKSAPTAYDVKDVHDRYRQLTDDDLKQIPVMPAGSRLEQGATYANLSDEQPREFTATGDMVTGGYDRLVLKSSVAYWVWNRLIGVNSRERLDESGNG